MWEHLRERDTLLEQNLDVFLGWVFDYKFHVGGFWLCENFWNLISLEKGVEKSQNNKKHVLLLK